MWVWVWVQSLSLLQAVSFLSQSSLGVEWPEAIFEMHWCLSVSSEMISWQHWVDANVTLFKLKPHNNQDFKFSIFTAHVSLSYSSLIVEWSDCGPDTWDSVLSSETSGCPSRFYFSSTQPREELKLNILEILRSRARRQWLAELSCPTNSTIFRQRTSRKMIQIMIGKQGTQCGTRLPGKGWGRHPQKKKQKQSIRIWSQWKCTRALGMLQRYLHNDFQKTHRNFSRQGDCTFLFLSLDCHHQTQRKVSGFVGGLPSPVLSPFLPCSHGSLTHHCTWVPPCASPSACLLSLLSTPH